MAFLENKTVVARKNHECTGCYELIPKGSSHTVRVFADAGEINRWRLCPLCLELERLLPKMYQDDIYAGDFREFDEWKELKARAN